MYSSTFCITVEPVYSGHCVRQPPTYYSHLVPAPTLHTDINFCDVLFFRIACIKQVLGVLQESVSEFSTVLEMEPSYVPALKGLYMHSYINDVCMHVHVS